MIESQGSGAASGRAPRVPLSAEVRIRFEDRAVLDAAAANVSLTGMFVRTPRPRPAGTRLGFALRPRGESPVRGVSEVVWCRLQDESEERPAGMGILFFRLQEDGREVISGVVDRHLRRSR